MINLRELTSCYVCQAGCCCRSSSSRSRWTLDHQVLHGDGAWDQRWHLFSGNHGLDSKLLTWMSLTFYFVWSQTILGLETGLPRLDSPPLPSSAFSGPLSPTPFSKTEQTILSPLPVRLRPLAALQPPDTLETWTRSPTKSEVDPVVGSWHLTTGGSDKSSGNAKPYLSKRWLGFVFPMCSTYLTRHWPTKQNANFDAIGLQERVRASQRSSPHPRIWLSFFLCLRHLMLIGASFWLSKQFRWDSTILLTCFISSNFLTALIWESILCGASFAEAPGKGSYLCLFMQTLLNAKGQPVIVGIGRSLLTTVHLGTTVNVKNWSIFCRDCGEA